MLAPTSSPDAGRRLRAERERLRLSTRDGERMSQVIALKRNDSDYYISHTWVADVEAGKFKPKLYKLHSLSLIYQRSLDEILAFFGLDVRQVGQEQGLVDLPRTCLVPSPVIDANGTITAPLGLRDKVGLEQTNLVSRMFERWGEVPIGLLQKTDWRTSLYGYIGLEDYTLYPHIRPGSLVQIDARQTKIKPKGWQNEFDRPIYFVDLRDSYMCSWCEVDGNQLVLIPSPQSRRPARHVRYPGEADIVGRVTVVTMPIAEMK
jgi:transcriptional regulator with XRE-family HTH domain